MARAYGKARGREKEIGSDYRSGVKMIAIEAKYNIDQKQVYRIISKLGIPKDRRWQAEKYSS